MINQKDARKQLVLQRKKLSNPKYSLSGLKQVTDWRVLRGYWENILYDKECLDWPDDLLAEIREAYEVARSKVKELE